MKLSRSFLIMATMVVAALVVVGGFGLAHGDDKLFFVATFGALICSGLSYSGAFMQGLRPAPRLPRGRVRSVGEEIEAFAEANPEHPGLRRLHGWFAVILFVVVTVRVVAIFASR